MGRYFVIREAGACDRHRERSAANLSATVALGALMVPFGAAAQTVLPDINVIAPSPLSSSRPAKASSAPARRPSTAVRRAPQQTARTPSGPRLSEGPATATPAAAPAAPAATPATGTIDRDKVPANTEVLAPAVSTPRSPPTFWTRCSSISVRVFERPIRQRVPARFRLPRLYRLAGARHPAGDCSLSERRAHQRSLWRHRQLGFHPGHGDPPAVAGAQQSDLRPQCHRRRGEHRNEERLHLSGQGSRCEAGSFGRFRDAQVGVQDGNLAAYAAFDATNDDGWRQFSSLRASPYVSRCRRAQRRHRIPRQLSPAPTTGWARRRRRPSQLLAQKWSAVYTWPQTTRLQLAFLTASLNHNFTNPVVSEQCLFSRLPARPCGRQRHRRPTLRSRRGASRSLCIGDGNTPINRTARPRTTFRRPPISAKSTATGPPPTALAVPARRPARRKFSTTTTIS